MYSVGIDVSKGVSKVCMISLHGEVIISPFDVNHTIDELRNLVDKINIYDNVKVVLEATGRYHLPLLSYLLENEVFVSCINPLTIKKFSDLSIRRGKTDKKDALKIAKYGIVNWSELKLYETIADVFLELRSLSRQYYSYMKLKINAKQNLDGLADKVMPSIKDLLGGTKMRDFTEYFWHYDNITKLSLRQFTKKYNMWAKKKGYHQSDDKANKIYELALNSIPTLDSNYRSTKLLVRESIKTITMVEISCVLILTQMEKLASELPEYKMLIEMKGIGVKLAVRLIAEIGDVRNIYSKKALIALAGLDAPPFESGRFVGTNRHISKRGNKYIRKTGYEIMKSYKTHKPDDDVYRYMIKKELEGMPKKKAKIAALNKFLRIYYAKVSELYT